MCIVSRVLACVHTCTLHHAEFISSEAESKGRLLVFWSLCAR